MPRRTPKRSATSTTFAARAKGWTGERRVIARIDATRKGSDTRFVVTNLSGTARWLYEVLYRGPSAASWPRSFQETDRGAQAAPRLGPPSCSKATANQFRLLVHTASYWLLHTLKGLAPKTSFWRDAQFDTIRLAFIKLAARVTELVTRIKVSLASSYPHKQSLARFAGRALAMLP